MSDSLNNVHEQFAELQARVKELEERIVYRSNRIIEELNELVASLEEVRTKEYAFKQARVEELEHAHRHVYELLTRGTPYVNSALCAIENILKQESE